MASALVSIKRDVRELQVFDDWTERQRRQVGQAADDDDDAEQKTDKQRAVGRERTLERGMIVCAASDPATASTGTMTKKRPTNIPSASVRL